MRNLDLLNYHKDFSQNTGQNFILRSRIQDFYKEHGGRINSLNEKVIALQEKYFVTDGFNAQGQLKIKQEKVFTEEVKAIKNKFWFFEWTKKEKIKTPKMQYVMKEGMTFEDYNKEMNALMMQDIVPIHTNGNGLQIAKK